MTYFTYVIILLLASGSMKNYEAQHFDISITLHTLSATNVGDICTVSLAGLSRPGWS